MVTRSKVRTIQEKVEQLEDELSKKKMHMAAFVFQHVFDTYGGEKAESTVEGIAVLNAFSLVVHNWDDM